MKLLDITLFGKPATQGSKRGFPIPRKDGTTGVRLTDDCAELKAWRQQVAQTALAQFHDLPVTHAVELRIVFYRPRPKGHFGTGRNAHKVKASAPRYPATIPDLTKLTRAVEDALKGVVYRNDSQVVRQDLWKKFGVRYETTIEVALVGCLDLPPHQKHCPDAQKSCP